MKKIGFIVLLAFVAMFATAQDLKKVSNAYLLGKYDDAKMEIDKVSADPKFQSKPEVWFWKASIYGALYDDPNLSIRYTGAGEVAYTSFQEYAKLDPSFKIMNESPIPGKAIIDFLYRGNLKTGISTFDKKQWDSAYKYFARAAEIGDLISKNNWRGNNQPLDTTTVLFTGYAAQNAKKSADAARYYARIADLKVNKVPAAGEIKDVYEYLVYYYLDTKNNDAFLKYLALAKEVFPGNIDNWADYETDFIEKNYSLAEKAAAYDKADAAGTLTPNQYLAFGNMFYNIKDEESDKLDSMQKVGYRNKAADAFMKGYKKDNNNGLAAFNAGLINYNDWVGFDEQYENNIRKIADLNKSKALEKDPKKKPANDAKINKQIDAVKADNARIEKIQHGFADKAIEWMEVAFKVLSTKPTLDKTEKNIVGKAIDDLANLYLWKRDKSKGNNVDYDKYDALYKRYDGLHGKTDFKSASNENNSGNSMPIAAKGKVKLEKRNGVYYVKCKVNGLDLDMIFDTGASDVSISLVEANFMLKNGQLKGSDILGESKYRTADGSISVGTNILLREIEIGGVKFTNIKASVVKSLTAPILLGQSVLEKFVNYTIDNGWLIFN